MKQNLKKFYIILLLLTGVVLKINVLGQTVTPTATNWSCGNENLSPSTYTYIAAQ